VKVWHRGPHLDQPMPPPQDLFDFIQNGGLLRGFNVAFEFAIWSNVCVPKYGWPPIKIEQCIDTMAQAAAHNLPQSLGRVAEVLGLPDDAQKSKRGKYLIVRLCKPHPPTKDRKGIWVEDADLFAELCDYCAQDVVTEEAVARKLRPLTEYEQGIWVLTQKINQRGIPLAIDEVSTIRDVVELEKERLNRELAEVTQRKVLRASDRKGLLNWVNDQGTSLADTELDVFEEEDEDRPGHEEPTLANMQAGTVQATLGRTDLSPAVRRALEIRALVAQTSTAKYDKMLKVCANDGSLKNMLVYHGAGTGRWASRGGVNAQNFARPTLDQQEIDTAFATIQGLGPHAAHEALQLLFEDKVMDVAVSCLRGVLKAPKGHTFIDADFSSVENRVAAWVSGQQDKLDMFAAGLDEYKTFASNSLYKVPYAQVTGLQRQRTKPVILGGIFGLGAAALVEYAKQYGVDMTLDQAKIAIRALRREYRHVVATWYACGDAMVAAIQNPKVWYDAGPKFKFLYHKGFLRMKLPSGRIISWYEPEVVPEMITYEKDILDEDGKVIGTKEVTREVNAVWVRSIDTLTRQFIRHRLIGSSAFQSGVQGTARDILAQGVLNVEARGYPVVGLFHDEALACVRQGFGSERDFAQALCEPQDWYADLPLTAEGYESIRFKK
jgi:DNA polymerase